MFWEYQNVRKMTEYQNVRKWVPKSRNSAIDGSYSGKSENLQFDDSRIQIYWYFQGWEGSILKNHLWYLEISWNVNWTSKSCYCHFSLWSIATGLILQQTLQCSFPQRSLVKFIHGSLSTLIGKYMCAEPWKTYPTKIYEDSFSSFSKSGHDSCRKTLTVAFSFLL